MADFFCSAEMDEVPENEREMISNALHHYCRNELTKDVNNSKKYLQDLANGKTKEYKCHGPGGGGGDCKHFQINGINIYPTDPASEFADGEWNVPEPRRNDKKVN